MDEAMLPCIVQKPVLKTGPKPIPPPPLLTPKPAQFSPATVTVAASIQHEREEKEEMEDETDETLVEKLSSTASQNHTALGEAVGIMGVSLKNKIKELRISSEAVSKLTEEKEVLNGQLKEAEEKNVSLRDQNENVVKKAEEDVNKAISEQAEWKNKYENGYVELNEQLKAAKNESLETESLRKKVDECKKTIKNYKATIKNLQISEENMKKKLEEAEKNILNEKRNSRSKCLQNVKLETKINAIQKTTSELQSDINKFMECDKVDKMTIQNLETERDSLNLSIEDLKAKVSEKSDEMLNISRDLEKERNDIQIKGFELENNAKIISELENKVKVLEQEKDDIVNDIPMTVSALMDEVRDSWIERYCEEKRKLSESCLLSSSQREIAQEPSSMKVEENDDHGTGNMAEQFESQEDVTQTSTSEKRKYSTSRSSLAKKKKC